MRITPARIFGGIFSLAVVTAVLWKSSLEPLEPADLRIAHLNPETGYRYQLSINEATAPENLVILTFSGGGTRAAAFAYGVLEALHRLQETGPSTSEPVRLIDRVSAITGVSGGSFPALAYGLYRNKLFDRFEKDFLNRDIERELMLRWLKPENWKKLIQSSGGRSQLAADHYDDILFKGATFADLGRAGGPMIVVSATDIRASARFDFTQGDFDLMCSDLNPIRLSLAAAASSAVPGILSPISLRNFRGECEYKEPAWLTNLAQIERHPNRAAQRVTSRSSDAILYPDQSERPYIHLVDGSGADNLGVRFLLNSLDKLEAKRLSGQPTPLDHVKRIVVIMVDSGATPETTWDKDKDGPGILEAMMHAIKIPITMHSAEGIELLRDKASQWETMQEIQRSFAVTDPSNPVTVEVAKTPPAKIYLVDVSFSRLRDVNERAYLNSLPTSLSLPADAVNRLRTAAKHLVLESAEFRSFLASASIQPTK